MRMKPAHRMGVSLHVRTLTVLSADEVAIKYSMGWNSRPVIAFLWLSFHSCMMRPDPRSWICACAKATSALQHQNPGQCGLFQLKAVHMVCRGSA